MSNENQKEKNLSEGFIYEKKYGKGVVGKKDFYTDKITYEVLNSDADDISPIVQALHNIGVKDEFGSETDYSIPTDDIEEYVDSVKRKTLSIRENALKKIITDFVSSPTVKKKLSSNWFVKRNEVSAVSKWVNDHYTYEIEEINEMIKKLFN